MNEKLQLEQVIRFWQAIEASTPQKADKPNPTHPTFPIYLIDVNEPSFPWLNQSHRRKRIEKNKTWRYTFQCGLYDTNMLAKLLEERIGSHEEVFDERRNGDRSRLFDLAFDDYGYPIPESFVLSMACWSAGQILHFNGGIEILERGGQIDTSGLQKADDDIPDPDSGYSSFDELSRRLVQRLVVELAEMRESGQKLERKWLDTLVVFVASKCFLPHGIIEPGYIAKCYQIKKAEQPDETKTSQGDDLLNSFFIGDLKKLAKAWEKCNVGKGITEYMTAVASAEHSRQDLRSTDGVNSAFQSLIPERMPNGCWPSNHPLAFSQQLAVNEIWQRLSNGSGIFAVNGPPGTGKTTLLRDIVATVVTERAIRLVNVKSGVFKPKTTQKLGDKRIPYYAFRESITGNAIVVASANNGAVENVSLELPGIEAVSQGVTTKSDYFANLAATVLGKPAWGLLAARLGNKANRREFVDRFWWLEPKEHKEGGNFLQKNYEEGLRYYLKSIQEGKRQPAVFWGAAVERFKAAQAREISVRKSMIDASKMPAKVAALHEDIEKIAIAMSGVEGNLEDHRRVVARHSAEVERLSIGYAKLHDHLREIQHALQSHDVAKPGLLFWLSTLGRSHREWWARRRVIEEEMDGIRRECNSSERALTEAKAVHGDAQGKLADLDRDLSRKHSELAKARSELAALESALAEARASLGECWPNNAVDDGTREKSSPWAVEKWRKAREDIFLAALDVHRAFIEDHPDEMLANLGLACDWLQGKDMPETLARTALDSLCFVVPVISTAFASVPRMFKQIGSEGIGWLLIDEAGQALPQQAAGAIWRARRTVIVGDPNQLEPVIPVSAAVEGAFARYYAVEPPWWPSETSAQRLADQAMDIGTWLPDPVKGQLWVGCPLRVHRRCDDPMFSISNKIAYNKQMVHGKAKKESPLPECHWINVRSEDGEGHWVPAEGVAARKLLLDLKDQYGLGAEDIFLISPFRDGANKLRPMARNLGLDEEKTGTVHTTQGKEADVVVLVLGGNPKKPGAKSWAAEKPNLLNVAVSRAKKRLYVIGDIEGWRRQKYFRVLADCIPARMAPESTTPH